jgi:hypothetical protein
MGAGASSTNKSNVEAVRFATKLKENASGTGAVAREPMLGRETSAMAAPVGPLIARPPSIEDDIEEASTSPPASPDKVVFEGQSKQKSASECLGTFAVVQGKEVYSRKVWRHTKKSDRWLAFSGSNWYVQVEKSLGKDEGILKLADQCDDPTRSGLMWEALAEKSTGKSKGSKSWVKQPRLKLRELQPPQPVALVLTCGSAPLKGGAGMTSCLGLFKLADKQINGRAVWRHSTNQDRLLTFTGLGWTVQTEESIGSDAEWLSLRDAGCASPDTSKLLWSAHDGKKWARQPSLCCRVPTVFEFNDLPAPAALRPEGKVKAVGGLSTSQEGKAKAARQEAFYLGVYTLQPGAPRTEGPGLSRASNKHKTKQV